MSKYSSDPKPGEKEISKKLIDYIVEKPGFDAFEKPAGPGRDFFIFQRRGDEVSGFLGPPKVNLRRNSTYPIKQDDGSVIEVFSNKLLHRIIKQNDLVYKKVRIVYVGLMHTGKGRPRKIYRIYLIDWAGEQTEQLSTPVKTKRSDNGRGKK